MPDVLLAEVLVSIANICHYYEINWIPVRAKEEGYKYEHHCAVAKRGFVIARNRAVWIGTNYARASPVWPHLCCGRGLGEATMLRSCTPISISERAWSREGKAILTTWVTQLLAAAQDWRKRWQTQVGIKVLRIRNRRTAGKAGSEWNVLTCVGSSCPQTKLHVQCY